MVDPEGGGNESIKGVCFNPALRPNYFISTEKFNKDEVKSANKTYLYFLNSLSRNLGSPAVDLTFVDWKPLNKYFCK